MDEQIRSSCAAHIEEETADWRYCHCGQRRGEGDSLTAAVTTVEGYSKEQVKNQLTAAVSELLLNQPFGEVVKVPFSRFLACLLQCPGVADYSSFTVDGGTAAVTLQAEDAPVVGTVTIT